MRAVLKCIMIFEKIISELTSQPNFTIRRDDHLMKNELKTIV